MTSLDATAQVEAYLLDEGRLPDVELLQRTRLAGHAFIHTSRDHPAYAALHAVVSRVNARHLAAKAAVAALLTAWCRAGVDVLVFKGFYLAECVYPHAAQRPYADVDLLVRVAHSQQALAVATETGWRVTWSRLASLANYSHEEAILERNGIKVELHRYVVDCAAPRDAVQRRLTKAAWSQATRVRWQGIDLHTLDPLDSVLLGVVLARAWSGGDDWHLKPTDLLDLRALAERFEFDRHDLERRAQELRCERTLALFLQRCDPWKPHVSLRPPSWSERQRLYLAMTSERGHLGLERLSGKLLRAPATASDVIRHLPRLLAWRLRLQRDPELHHHDPPQHLPHGSSVSFTLVEKERLVRGIKWGARVLIPLGDPCILRSLALAEALRARGAQVALHTGRSSAGTRTRRHAWITLEEYTLHDLYETTHCKVDEELILFPNWQAVRPARREGQT